MKNPEKILTVESVRENVDYPKAYIIASCIGEYNEKKINLLKNAWKIQSMALISSLGMTTSSSDGMNIDNFNILNKNLKLMSFKKFNTFREIKESLTHIIREINEFNYVIDTNLNSLESLGVLNGSEFECCKNFIKEKYKCLLLTADLDLDEVKSSYENNKKVLLEINPEVTALKNAKRITIDLYDRLYESTFRCKAE